MTKPEHTRPFNLEHARAGAPYSCKNGEAVTIIKWDGRHPQGYCLIGVRGDEDTPDGWRPDGFFGNSVRSDLNLVMIPLDWIDGKPVFVGDVLELKNEHCTGAYEEYAGPTTVLPGWAKEWEPGIWRWPAPAKVYPETRMTGFELADVVSSKQALHLSAIGDDGLKAIANAALRHAIDAGQVITREDYREQDKHWGKAEQLLESLGYRFLQNEWRQMAGVGDRAARDMAVAEAVRDKITHLVAAAIIRDIGIPTDVNINVDLAAIIAQVPK